MKNKIAMISYHTCPQASLEGKETGGMNVFVLELSKELAALGYHVDMFTRCHDDDSKRVVHVVPNLRLMHLPAGPVDPIPKKSLLNYLDEFTANMLQFIQEEGLHYDLLHCHYYMSGLIGLKLNAQLPSPLPILMRFHTLALMKNLVARSRRERESQERIDAEFLLAREATRIMAPSESAKQYLQYLYGVSEARIHVVPPGFNKDLFRPIDKSIAKSKIGADASHRILAFVGRIEPLKGIDVLMYAIKILRQKRPDMPVCLWVLGGDVSQDISEWSEELQRLEQLRKTLGMQTTVKFVGQKSQEELPYYYNAAEMVVMPSNYESFGMAALEAMACGVPVITTNVAGISSFLDERHKPLVTSAHNPLLLASRMEDLLENDEKRARLGHDIHDKVQDLTWDRIAEKIAAVYQKIT